VRFHLVTGTTGARNGWKIASTYASDALVVRVGTGEVVPGLDEALRGMRVGGRRRALVPPTLGYSGKVGKGQAPVPTEFAAYQRFKNIYLNSARPFIPDGMCLASMRHRVLEFLMDRRS
jgi:FKBP-type peptidyl-prolyl cis-trans isomerase